ncbi:ABC transporter permease [Caldibacillus lycopersici]|uniref:ABC transporter permease n=1 Tax=Perspicuibacillus lycopersici TaxID=1325689 RepID=A0AAE3ITL6_9BACI|nr:ABC transporter permease [Perspicuibacillus lycopersici]MCU9612524.1 ABC transporter permease [Perspicuibacillus lycopersici]
MNNFWVVLSHTYLSKIKTKQFIISTLITLALILVMANITNIIDFFQSDEDVKETVAVLDETNELSDTFKVTIGAINEDIEIISSTVSEDELKKDVLEGELDAYVLLQYDGNNLPKATYYSETLSNSSLSQNIEMALQQLKMSLAANQLQLTPDQLTLLNDPVEFEQVAIGDNVKSEEELNQARGLVYVLLFVIYFSVIMYATMIATEVATEKSSRVMEILISSVHPVAQMFAKIFGVALVGLTQLVIWLGGGYIALRQNMDEMTGGFFSFFGFGNTSISTIVYAVVFFLLGFLLYATMAAFLGSLVSRIEDVNQVIQPMIWLIVIGFMLAMTGLGTPDATYVTISSYIPVFTPMIMFMRVGLLELPIWEPVLGIAVLILTIIVLAIFGARVYKGGVLMYGNSSALKDIKKALQLTKNK